MLIPSSLSYQFLKANNAQTVEVDDHVQNETREESGGEEEVTVDIPQADNDAKEGGKKKPAKPKKTTASAATSKPIKSKTDTELLLETSNKVIAAAEDDLKKNVSTNRQRAFSSLSLSVIILNYAYLFLELVSDRGGGSVSNNIRRTCQAAPLEGDSQN